MSSYAQPSPRVRTPEQRQRSIDAALSKAEEQARAGILPTLRRSFTSPDGLETQQHYVVPSRMTQGAYYHVVVRADVDGLHTHCHDCEAAHAGRLCWHRAACWLAALGRIGYHDGQQPVITKAELHGRPTRNRVLVDADGNGTQPDPWPATDDVTAYAAAV